jgi:hypothetical protein
MQLRDARLCLDCDDVHQDASCPACGSESFAFVSRWIPQPEGRRPPRPTSSPQAEVYRELLSGDRTDSATRRLLKRGILGLTALGLAGWAWRTSRGDGTNGGSQTSKEV